MLPEYMFSETCLFCGRELPPGPWYTQGRLGRLLFGGMPMCKRPDPDCQRIFTARLMRGAG